MNYIVLSFFVDYLMEHKFAMNMLDYLFLQVFYYKN